jgi:hypothetical protein
MRLYNVTSEGRVPGPLYLLFYKFNYPHGPDIRSRAGLCESRKSRRNGPWTLAFVVPVDTPGGPSTIHYTPRSVSLSLSLFVSLVLSDTAAAGGVEAAVLARLHHVALPLWADDSGRLHSCAATGRFLFYSCGVTQKQTKPPSSLPWDASLPPDHIFTCRG